MQSCARSTSSATKRDGGELAPDQIDSFVRGATTGEGWDEYQLSALLMAIFLRGMTPAETAHLTRAMADSGKRLDLSDIPGPKVDKHSTGGVGDKTSLILGPLAAACGVVVPMMSGRGLGHSGGTLDKLESIPGFRVGLSEDEFRDALRSVGLGMIGQTADVAPADKTLYALRDVTATVESIPLITASILSKKLAEGISGLVMDVKCGRGAFMKTRAEARALAESLVRVGTANGLKTTALITAMDAPLGRYVGNSLEVIESIETLKGNGPRDLTDLSVLLAARMVRARGPGGRRRGGESQGARGARLGAGLEVFRKCIEQQGGDPRVIDDYSRLPTAPRTMEVVAPRAGYVTEMVAGRSASRRWCSAAAASGPRTASITRSGSSAARSRARPVRAGQTVFEVHYRRRRGCSMRCRCSKSRSRSATRRRPSSRSCWRRSRDDRPAHRRRDRGPRRGRSRRSRTSSSAPRSRPRTARIVAGCNVESASYGLTICAERVALFAGVVRGLSALHARRGRHRHADSRRRRAARAGNCSGSSPRTPRWCWRTSRATVDSLHCPRTDSRTRSTRGNSTPESPQRGCA